MNSADKWKEFVEWWEKERRINFTKAVLVDRINRQVKALQKGDNTKQIQLEEVESEASIIDDTEIPDGQGF